MKVRRPALWQQWYSEYTAVVFSYWRHSFSLLFCFLYIRYEGTVLSERLSHRLAPPLFETLYAVGSKNYSRPRSSEKPKLRSGIGLALGGGFARGFAHLGALRELEGHQIPVACIAGSSIGSILGAAYASGTPLARIIEKCREIRFRDFARWHVSRLGLASNERLGALVERFFASRQFEDLEMPLAIVATDLGTGDPVIFRQGPLADAIRASCAFPGLFEPVQIGTRYLADGGLVAPVPTKAARELGAQTVVAISVGMHDGHRGAPSNIFQVVSRAVSAAQKHQLEAWERHADLVFRPAVQTLAWDDFERIDEAMDAGAAAVRAAIPQIQKLLAARIDQPFEPGRQGEYLFAETV